MTTRLEKIKALAAREPCDKVCREAQLVLKIGKGKA